MDLQTTGNRPGRVRLRNGPHGYGLVTKALHWLTVVAVAAQFAVGWSMDVDEDADRREEAFEAEAERLEEEAESRGEAAEEQVEQEIEQREEALEAGDDDSLADVAPGLLSGEGFADGLSLPEVHVLLGSSIVLLAVLRLLWRRWTPLPPWAEHLSRRERRAEALLEKLLLGLLVAVPVTGMLLLGTGDDWLPLHVAAQIAFLAAIAAHVGLVLEHTVLRRNRHLSRML
ncbi:cytochrome b [Blastococcus sp. SYSU D00820]